MPRTFTAIILAGGQSSRMGRDKALLEIGDMPLIQQIYQVAQQCVDAVYIVTPWIERYREVLPASCRFIQEVPLPPNRAWGIGKPHGPLVGFAQGLAQVQTDWVLLLACDLPRLQVVVLQAGIEALNHMPEDAIALLPRQRKGWEPLCGFYRRRCLPNLVEFIEQGGRSFQGWLAQHSVVEWQLSDPQILFNCNTPDDLASL